MSKFKIFLLFLSIVLITIFLGKSLNPFSPYMFNFHDDTQAARISEFVLNLKSLKIPPRIAPDFSFKLGFPVFNYYAPSAYWITSLFHTAGLNVIDSLKISFLLAILLSFVFMFLFLKNYFRFYPSLLGALIYVSSPWIAIEIFIRGNIAETWCFALFPLALLMIIKNSESKSRLIYAITSIVLSLALTAHNVLSLVFLVFIVLFILINKNSGKNLFTLFVSVLISGYYFLPAISELSQTYAAKVAKSSLYVEGLLCPWQLWTTHFWGYGASIPGCFDGMPFMVGKPQILLTLLGGMFVIWRLFDRKNKYRKVFLFMAMLTFGSFFLTTTLSEVVSKILEPVLSYFQFPWRFLSFFLLGSAFLVGAINIPGRFTKLSFLMAAVGLSVVFYNGKFFTKYLMSNSEYVKKYVSQEYITTKAAFQIAEYLPISADYNFWRSHEPSETKEYIKDPLIEDGKFVHSLENKKIVIMDQEPFLKKARIDGGKIKINITYMPNWNIYLNGSKIIPEDFDGLGRPNIILDKPADLVIKYEQTNMQKAGNMVSLAALVYLLLNCFVNRKFKKIF